MAKCQLNDSNEFHGKKTSQELKQQLIFEKHHSSLIILSLVGTVDSVIILSNEFSTCETNEMFI